MNKNEHTHTHTDTYVLMAVYPNEPRLVSGLLEFPSPSIPTPSILLGQTKTCHISSLAQKLNTLNPSHLQQTVQDTTNLIV